MSSIKLKHASGNGVSITAPSSNPAADRTLELPGDADGIIAKTDASGNLAVTGDLTVDTDTLKVDSSSNRVGIGNDTSNFLSTSKLIVGSGSGDQGLTIYSGNSNNAFIHFADGTSGADKYRGYFEYAHGDNSIRVGVNDTERLRLLSSGGITFNGDTSSANALDDYEEGTWTPSVIAGNPLPTISNIVSAIYTKIGRLVTVSAYFNMNSTSSNTDNLVIGGLPFTAVGGNVYTYGTGRIGTIATPTFQVNTGATNINAFSDSGNAANWNNAIGTYVIFSVTYMRS